MTGGNQDDQGGAPGGDRDEAYMLLAIEQARLAAEEGEVPIGAVIVSDGRVIARGRNRRESRRDPTAHAEMEAIRQTIGQFASWRVERAALYVTLEPCPMCAGAIVQSRIDRVVYGCADPKAGAAATLYSLLSDPRLNHRCEVRAGVLEDQCRELLRSFFRARRASPSDGGRGE